MRVFFKRLRFLPTIACCVLVALGVAAGGSEDPGFDRREHVVTREPPPKVSVGSVLPGPRGGSYVIANSEPAAADRAGDGGRLVVLRYDRMGRPVRSFGRRGIYRTSFPGGPMRALAALRQRDGRLVIVGSIGRAFPGTQDFAVVRLYPDGTLDGAFGTGGTQTLDLGGAAEVATDVAVQPDGALVVAGWTQSERPNGQSNPEMVLLRLRPDGRFDDTFANGGVMRFPPRSPEATATAHAVTVTPDGTIVMGGTAGWNSPKDTNWAPVIARVRPDGGDGVLVDVPASNTTLAGMVLDRSSGRLYLAGTARRFESDTTRMWVAALRPDLSLDSGFGAGGTAFADFRGTPYDIGTAVIQDSRGRIVVAGAAGERPPAALDGPPPRAAFAFARFTTHGRLDPAFGRRGRALLQFRRRQNVAHALIEQPRGRLLAAGIGGGESPFAADATGRTVALGRVVSDR